MLFHRFVHGAKLVRRHPSRFLVTAFALILSLYYVSIYIYPPTQPFALPPTTAAHTLLSIPHHVWQIWIGPEPPEDLVNVVGSWQLKNQDYLYTLLSNDGANAFVREHYADRVEVLNLFLEVKLPVFRSDLLRYMILESVGGVYSDLDVACKKPIREWIPEELGSQVRAVVGIEYDQLGGPPLAGMDEPIQFCQWTLAAGPNHPIMRRAVTTVVASLQAYAAKTSTSFADIDPEQDRDVMAVTGPVVWTHAVLDAIGEMVGETVDYQNFTGLKAPRLFGDVLVLPIDGFATGQGHSGASNTGEDPPTAMVRHLWKSSWKHQWKNSGK